MLNIQKHYDCIILGAGLAGLTAAYELKKSGLTVLVLEASTRLGGAIDSKTYHAKNGQECVYEWGPNSFLTKAENFCNMADELGISSSFIKTDFQGSRRFIYKDGLQEVPVGPLPFLTTGLLSIFGKLRVLFEPFAGSAKENESVSDFVNRKFGSEILNSLVSTFLQGIWAGDVAKLEAKSVLKKLVELDADYGSVLKGLIRSAKKNKNADKKEKTKLSICSFQDGMHSLIDALAESIGAENIIFEAKYDLRAVAANDYKLVLEEGAREISSSNLIFACKSFQAAKLLGDSEISKLLNKIYYAPVALVATAVDKVDCSASARNDELDGFGYLVHESAKTKTIGCLWSSKMFGERELDDEYLFVSILGGAKKSEIIDFSLEQLEKLTVSEQKMMLNLSEDTEVKVVDSVLIKQAIPQYNLGHSERIEKIIKLIEAAPGMYLCGNYLKGVSLEDTVSSAKNVAEAIKEIKTKALDLQR